MSSTKQVHYTIYCHTHIESGRRYIGLTKKTTAFRWNQHVQNSKKKTGKGCRHFWNAIRKYGKDAFSHEVLEVHTDLDQANLAEEWWIRQLDTRNPEFGFNLSRGGYHVKRPVSNPWDRPDYRAKMLEVMRSSEFVNAHKEACNSQEVAALRRKALKREFSDSEHRFALAERMKNKTLSKESREKIASANRNRIVSEETRAKLSKNSTFRNMSAEARAKSAHTHSLLPKKTHCKHGHSLVDAYIRSNRERICRVCVKERDKRRRELRTADK